MWRMEGADIPGPAGPEGVVDQRPSSRAEVLRVAAEVPDVLVAGDGPESRAALVHRILGAQARQHLVVVLPDEEGRVPRVDALVPGHGPSVLCSAVRTHDDSLSFGQPWLPAATAERNTVASPPPEPAT